MQTIYRMKKSVFLFSLALLLLLLLSGCRTRRQSRSYREVTTSALATRSDSLFLRQMKHLNRNRTVQLEHIVFAAPDSSQVPPMIHSITRITAAEQAAQHTSTSVEAGTVSKTVAQQSETSEKEKKYSASLLIYLGILLLVFLAGLIKNYTAPPNSTD